MVKRPYYVTFASQVCKCAEVLQLYSSDLLVVEGNKKKLQKSQMEVDNKDNSSGGDMIAHTDQGEQMETEGGRREQISLSVKPQISKERKKKTEDRHGSRSQKSRKTKALLKAIEFSEKRNQKITRKTSAKQVRTKLKNLY
eukprot:TRINITY_DN7065_c1_g3_i1.p3 TRINITY_DN7065_c1_g3~~TRINITY_DN7065_c1_g3_i1.p3  ORF type:complete len:161 (-),score=11.97 TRINITY_DN7065_c1_g3_i1:330-752(-)